MFDDLELRFSEAEAKAFLEKLMPEGFAGADVMAELAPNGWENCGLVHAFHPALEHWHAERVAMYHNLKRLRQRSDAVRRERGEEVPRESDLPPTLEDSRAEFEPTPVQAEDECREIVGRVLWGIFSDNHSVIADDGREIDLGSFRGASATLDWFDTSKHRESAMTDGLVAVADTDLEWADAWDCGDYLRFYMGLAFIHKRADYRLVYALVFRRLQAMGADWIYSFPRIHVFRLQRPDTSSDSPADYSPSEAFAKEQQDREDEAAFEKMQAELDAAYRQSAEAAAMAEPPPIVQAYRQVYGRFPSGWPPRP